MNCKESGHRRRGGSVPKLGPRLRAVANQVRSRVHADVGADHAYLLFHLLREQRIESGIAVENKLAPYQNAKACLSGENASIRLGNGLSVINEREIESLTICGMGARSIIRILEDSPTKIPQRFILQPNGEPELIRQWAYHSGNVLLDECLVFEKYTYWLGVFTTGESSSPYSPDTAYSRNASTRELQLLFGPHLIRRRDRLLMDQLNRELSIAERLPRRNDRTEDRMKKVVELQRMLAVET